MIVTRFRCVLLFCFVALTAGCQGSPTPPVSTYPWRTLHGDRPIIIAHRGASGTRPEHTLPAYALAIEQGADFIEPDIVMTMDGVPVCRHDLHLSDSTDVAQHPEFSGRRRTFRGRDDWFVMDFTLGELKTLRAKQVFGDRDRSHDGRYQVPTLAEAVALIRAVEADSGRRVGLYIEIKRPADHRALGLDPSVAVLDILSHLNRPTQSWPIYLQCFERDEIGRLSGMTQLPLILLAGGEIDFATLPENLAGLGLSKSLIEIRDGNSALIDQAHDLGLEVHAWTFRDDRLPDETYATGADEIAAFLDAGIDAVFTDFPESGIRARLQIEGR